jgi:hypothetical protein
MVSIDNAMLRVRGMAAIAAAAFTVLVVTGALPAAGQPTAAPNEAPTTSGLDAARGHFKASRKGSSGVGDRGHGFVRDEHGAFTTVDAPGAGRFTAVFGIDDQGATVGGYVDKQGRWHGFVRRDGRFTTIDFPGAKGTLVARMNARGQIVGAYSEDATTPALG